MTIEVVRVGRGLQVVVERTPEERREREMARAARRRQAAAQVNFTDGQLMALATSAGLDTDQV